MSNRKKGLFRLALVAGAGWIAFWSIYAWLGNDQIDFAMLMQEKLDEVYRGERTDAYWRSSAEIMAQMNGGSRKVALAVTWGVGVPVALLLLSPVAWWIYRGFRPRGGTMAGPRAKRFRVSGYDENDDVIAFETDDRERAKAQEKQMREDLRDVVFEMLRRI